ncbi:DUF413 domain-containing protein [Shewanella benthica]|uniref:DUF413 domain-containing protein n=1 Tax=Shewanella benthica TaxID=43661 RepID=UPI00187ACF0E|nr:DUF413 domain-containing protein [Shewanella benthica]MBE7216600.1 DUF413 domain-containing protein [Shewanella benthica]MCL1064727.1 DUF413 domain-containing protein [Shewanella benthica]
MSEESFRFGQKSFIDDVNFPRGFRKSGDFTLLEAETLGLYGDTMAALETGALEPLTQEENHFVKMLKHPHRAKTKLELVWIKYIKLVREPRRFHSLHSSSHKHHVEDFPPVITIPVETPRLTQA